MRHKQSVWFTIVAWLLCALGAHAQSWVPTRNIEIIHGSAPGGSNDKRAREVEKALAETKLIPTSMTVVSKAGGGGSIVNTGSGWGLKGGPRAASYCASKGAVVNLTRAMAIDHGPQGIRVTCVCPGDTDTAMLREEARQLGEDETRFLAEAAARPLARMGTPADIARAILFLATDASAWVTGTVLVVDGGGLA